MQYLAAHIEFQKSNSRLQFESILCLFHWKVQGMSHAYLAMLFIFANFCENIGSAIEVLITL